MRFLKLKESKVITKIVYIREEYKRNEKESLKEHSNQRY